MVLVLEQLFIVLLVLGRKSGRTCVTILVMSGASYYLCNCSGSISTSWPSSGSRNLSHIVNYVQVVPGSITEKCTERVNSQVLVLVYHISAVRPWTSHSTFLMAVY